MFRKELHKEIMNIFGMKAVDWAGEMHEGANVVYVEYLNVNEDYFSESHIKFSGMIRLSLDAAGRDKPVFGVLGSKFDKYIKRSSNTKSLSAVSTQAESDWRTQGILSVSKDFYFACEVEHDKTREKIKHFKWVNYE